MHIILVGCSSPFSSPKSFPSDFNGQGAFSTYDVVDYVRKCKDGKIWKGSLYDSNG